jgi:hypothetical protein
MFIIQIFTSNLMTCQNMTQENGAISELDGEENVHEGLNE